MAAKSDQKTEGQRLLTHITRFGEPIEDPGGEMDVSDRRLCCEVQSKKGKKKEEMCPVRKLESFEQLTLNLLSALAACLHKGCHTSHPDERDNEERKMGVGTCHAIYLMLLWMGSAWLHGKVSAELYLSDTFLLPL